VSIGLLGNKIGMTQIFDESGNIIPVTILKVGPCVVTHIKTKLKDGYDSIQIGYGNISNKLLNQPKLGHFQKSNIQSLNSGCPRCLSDRGMRQLNANGDF